MQVVVLNLLKPSRPYVNLAVIGYGEYSDDTCLQIPFIFKVFKKKVLVV